MPDAPWRAQLENGMGNDLVVPRDGALDLVALGALVHRLDPGTTPFRRAAACQIHVSGAEYNVVADASDCFGLRTGIVTAMVDYPIGDLVASQARAMGVRLISKRFEHDGVNGPNIAAVYSDRGYGVRAPVVFYNRSNEAAALLKPGDFDWADVFAGGVRWFHSGGVFAALSDTTPELIIEGMEVASSLNAVISFDLNYREKLWKVRGGRESAQSVLGRIMEHVDVLVGNEDDLQAGLGVTGPRFPSASTFADHFRAAAESAVVRYPRVKIVATTIRDVRSANRHGWTAIAWINGVIETAPVLELDVLDRVGGGDGFAAGFFAGLLSGETGQQALRLGWAHGALVTTYPGDTTMATLLQVRSLAAGGNARIDR